jgi:hypothetical protein
MISDIITAVISIATAGLGLLIGNLWGRKRGKEQGRNETLIEVERQQGRAYRETRERIDEAPILSDPDRAAEFLRARQRSANK